MPISRERLLPYLQDYTRETGNKTDRFICPITFRECDNDEVIEGHILNEALINTVTRKIPQYGKIDHFYGSEAERSLIDFLNLKEKTPLDILKRHPTFEIHCSDGTTLTAFFADSVAAQHAAGRLPTVDLHSDGEFIATAFVKTTIGDLRLGEPFDVVQTHKFIPLYWVGALLKASYLTLFDMLGYRVANSTWSGTVRWSLKGFYDDRGGEDSAFRHFFTFREAIKFMMPSDPSRKELIELLNFDTLSGREVILHKTPSETLFAASCVFKINNTTVTVVLPEAIDGTDPGLVLEWYEKLMKDSSLGQKTYRAKYIDGKWHFDPRGFPLVAHRPPE